MLITLCFHTTLENLSQDLSLYSKKWCKNRLKFRVNDLPLLVVKDSMFFYSYFIVTEAIVYWLVWKLTNLSFQMVEGRIHDWNIEINSAEYEIIPGLLGLFRRFMTGKFTVLIGKISNFRHNVYKLTTLLIVLRSDIS